MAKIVKGEERGRPGKWIVDYREGGKRKWKTCDTQGEAKTFLKSVLLNDSATYCTVDTNVTLADYGDKVIEDRLAFVKARTVEANREGFSRVKKYIGSVKVRELTPGQIVRFLTQSKAEGLANGTVRYSLSVLSLILNHARIDGVIAHNPAYGIGKQVRLQKSEDKTEIKAFTLEQRAAFIEAAKSSRHYVLYRFLLATGARLGEALALKVTDISEAHAVIRETFSRKYGAGTTKSGQVRTVDILSEVSSLLKKQAAKVAEQELAQGRTPNYLFVNEDGLPWNSSGVWKDFQLTLKRAGLPLHFSPHCTRHTYATLLLSNGESIQYVQQQLGHASITLTVDIYGKWIPLKSSGVQERIEGNGRTTSLAGVV